MLQSVRSRGVVQARVNVARASPRVFTDREWDAAVKTAAQMLAAAEGAETATAPTPVAPDAPQLPGRTFSDAQWEQAMKDAPMLLKTLEAIEKGASVESPSTSEPTAASTGVVRSTRVFSDEEWDAAIKTAAALQAADNEAEVCVLVACMYSCTTKVLRCSFLSGSTHRRFLADIKMHAHDETFSFSYSITMGVTFHRPGYTARRRI
jgi:hypothetical protein